MPPKGVDQSAREAMTTKIAQRLTTMLFSGQNMIDAARQIEAKCYDSAKDAMDYERKVVKRLAKAAKALEASQRPSMSESSARDLLREHGATLEWWRSSDVIGRRLRAIIDAATQAGSVGDEARTWASAALQMVEKLEKAATSLLKQLENRSGNLTKLPGYCTKLKESKAALEAHLDKLAPQWAPASIGEAAVESWPQAQDYVWGWLDVPATVRLDKICCYLDAKAMGRLEICGKNCLGDAQRAWQAKAAGLPRGTLGEMSTKQFLRAQTRARALLPPGLGGKSPFMFQHYLLPVSFDEFAFTIAVSWIEPGKPERSFAEFPFMRLISGHDEQFEFTRPPAMFIFVPPAGADQEALSACLRRVSQEFAEADGPIFPGRVLEQMDPTVYLTCTRRRDGAATRVGMFSRLHAVNDVGDEGETEGSLYFGDGKLLLTNLYSDGDEEALEMTLHLVWDAPSGRVRAFGCHLYVNGAHGDQDFPEESFLALLNARLDESVRD